MAKMRCHFYFITILSIACFCILLIHLKKYDISQQPQEKIFEQWIVSANANNHKKYLVNTKGCKIPNFSPFDPTLKEKIHIVDGKAKCTPKYNLDVYKDGNTISVGSLPSGVSCKLFEYDENGFDEYQNLKAFSSVKSSSEFYFVKCTRMFDKYYEGYFWNFEHKSKNIKSKKKVSVGKDDYNVLILGIDATSRLNRIRALRRTSKLLENKLGAIELEGYMKVADNTYPNMVALLTGKHENDNPNCKSKGPSSFDDCPYIWKEFTKKNYVTLLAEDQPLIGTFTLYRPGFKKDPVDHYLRKLMVNTPLGLNQHCIHNETENIVVLNYTSDFLKTYKNQLFFGITWLSGYSHESINTLQLVDSDFYNFFYNSLYKPGVFNNTIVFFLSDHGSRIEKIRQTHIGRFEDSLPFFYAIFPESFRKRYPERIERFKKNKNRLTTPFDVHNTMIDILHKGNIKDNNKYGYSLFEEIPTTRTCESAHVASLYCVCEGSVGSQIALDSHKKLASKYFVSYLNKRLFDNSNECEELSLMHVFSVKKVDTITKPGFVTLRVSLKVSPSNAVLETIVNISHDLKNSSKILSMNIDENNVNRLNRYGKQSWCVNDVFLKLFCYCKHQKS